MTCMTLQTTTESAMYNMFKTNLLCIYIAAGIHCDIDITECPLLPKKLKVFIIFFAELGNPSCLCF